MRTRRTALALALAAIGVLSVAGCMQSPTQVIPTSEPSSKPVFASDAAALAAAKKAYKTYIELSDEVAHDGGVQIDRLQRVDTVAQYKRDTKSFNRMRSDGHHTVGSSSFSDVALESSEMVRGKAVVTTYICLRIDGTHLLDSSGADVGADRTLAVPLQVSFISAVVGTTRLLVDRSDVWSGTNFCS